MTRKEQALQALAIARDENSAMSIRDKAIKELFSIKKAAKMSFEKFIGEDTTELTQLEASLDWKACCEEADNKADAALEVEDEKPKPAAPIVAQVAAAIKKPAKKKVDTNRGKITELCRTLLLEGDAPYAEIVATVIAKYPEAQTTARSVASIASDMRKAGKIVSMRRKGK